MLEPSTIKDYVAWTTEQAKALRERKLNDLDYDNLIEEIEDIAILFEL